MNRLVVQRLGAALARWLPESADAGGRPARVVVGWDARHRAGEFALDVARAVAGAGARALLLPGPQPTPVLAFALRHLRADAAVMCTASHNPPGDGGCKVYLRDGAQIAPPEDAALAAAVEEVAGEARPLPLAAPDDPAVERLDGAVVDAYAAHVAGLGLVAPAGARGAAGAGLDLPVVYTPLHGVAGELAVRLLGAVGFRSVHVVGAQAAPDPNFPTTPFPDPQEPGALALALVEAGRRHAGLVLANDPDGDRLGVAVPARGPGAGGWRVLTGNEIGVLLCEHVLARTQGDDRLVVSTYVSTRLVGRLARHHGVHHEEVPTGFKWIVRPALAHPEWRFVFGFEEALGFSVDPAVRDKDGLSSALAVAGLVAGLRARGLGVEDELERLSRRHGHHATRTWSVRLPGLAGAERARAVLGRWRSLPPAKLGRRAVATVEDLAAGTPGLPPADAMVVTCEDGARVVVRPSGTEPKLKVYLEVVETVAPGAGGYERACRAGALAVEELRAAAAAELGLTGA